jgi:hypothetical protein
MNIAPSSAAKDRCITCEQEFERGSLLVHKRLTQFDNACICQECVDVAMKRKPPGKLGGE